MKNTCLIVSILALGAVQGSLSAHADEKACETGKHSIQCSASKLVARPMIKKEITEKVNALYQSGTLHEPNMSKDLISAFEELGDCEYMNFCEQNYEFLKDKVSALVEAKAKKAVASKKNKPSAEELEKEKAQALNDSMVCAFSKYFGFDHRCSLE